MWAYVEYEKHKHKWMEMGQPICGRDFCDGCGDCLVCQWHEDAEWCRSNGGVSFWVIYLDDERNSFRHENPEPALV